MGQSTVTVAKPIPKRAGRTNSCSEMSTQNKPNFVRSKPIDIELPQNNSNELFSLKNNTPSKKDKSKSKWSKGWRDELCFGSPLDHNIINKDFDFEKNLALFDKQAIWNQINSQKPDVIKQTDKRQNNKYR